MRIRAGMSAVASRSELESVRWEGTVARFAGLVEGAGYGLTITPILEHAGVFLRGIGEGSEVVGKEMYVFDDRDGQLMAFRHDGFWQPMDTYREAQLLNGLWESGQAPWRVWA